MNEAIEGTFALDGLIEGRIPERADAKDLLHEWIGFAAKAKLKFSLELEGNSFSLLADNSPIQVAKLEAAPDEAVANALTELLRIFPAAERRHVISTIRTVEYGKGTEVQTVYAVGPDGAVQSRQRTVDAKTTPAPRQLTVREKFRIAAIGLVIALLVLSISSIFVDYRAALNSIIDAVRGFDPGAVEVEAGGFQDYLAVENKEAQRGGKELILTLKRTEAFPVKEADLQRLLDGAGKSIPARMTLEALARGYVHCEYFDKKNELLGFTEQRISGLRENETIKLVLPLPAGRRLARVVIAP